jgi:hypothetical protein
MVVKSEEGKMAVRAKKKGLSKRQAEALAVKLGILQDEIAEIERQSGLLDKREQVKVMRSSLTAYMVETDTSRIEAGPGKHARLIEATAERVWIAEDDDVPVDPPGKRSLKSIFDKATFLMLTKRVADPEKILEAVEEGLVATEDLAPAYYERMKAPYIRVFNAEQPSIH